MKQRELARLHVLNNVLEYQTPIGQAAEILGVSERHTRRLLSSYGRDGAAVLAHGNRGRQPHNAVLESEAAAVVRLARSLAGKPLAGFCATRGRRIQDLYGMVVHVIRCNTHYAIDNRR